MQELFVGLLFIGAIGYIANRFRQDFKAKNTGCAKGCGNCGQINLDHKTPASE